MSEGRTPTWSDRLDEPFRSDASFSRSVAASADAFVLIVVAAVAAVLLSHSGAGLAVVVLPFVAPALLLGWALAAARRFHRSVPASDTPLTEDAVVSWRIRERQAVASVLGPALVRNRLRRS